MGGGAAQFKRAFIDCWNHSKPDHGIELQYVSIDPNANQQRSQKKAGNVVVAGTAQAIPLRENSVDFLFDDEVLDTLPYRSVKFDGKHVTHEAFVHHDGRRLKVTYQPVQRDDWIEVVETILQRTHPRGTVYAFAPEYEDYWRESHRVLKPGGTRFSLDYNSHLGELLKSNDARHRQAALDHPYQQDLTHYIDFNLQRVEARTAGFRQADAYPLDAMMRSKSESIGAGLIGRSLLAAVK